MTNEEFKQLKVGAIVRHKQASESMVVTANYGGRCTAVRTTDISNPDEWDVIASAGEDDDDLHHKFKTFLGEMDKRWEAQRREGARAPTRRPA